MRKVVVIGSSPSLLNKRLGSVIDSYEHIVRINWYPSKGYEEDIGVTEDILVSNNKSVRPAQNAERVSRFGCDMNPNELWKITEFKNMYKFMEEHLIFDALCGLKAVIACHLKYKTPVDICGFYNVDNTYGYYYDVNHNERLHDEWLRSYKQREIINKLKRLGIIGKEIDETSI